MASSSSGSKPGVKAMERVTNKAPQTRIGAGAKPGVEAMKKEVNPVKGGGKKNGGGLGSGDFFGKRAKVRGKKK